MKRNRRHDLELRFILDENMIQGGPCDHCVGCLLNGRGHRVEAIQGTELEGADDDYVGRYAATHQLVVVTFDRDLSEVAKHEGCRCLIIKPPERTARGRLSAHYAEVVEMLSRGTKLVVLPLMGEPYSLS